MSAATTKDPALVQLVPFCSRGLSCTQDADCCACGGGTQTKCIAQHCACLGAQ